MGTKMEFNPDKDAGWGLIYRLNNLWAKVDTPALNGTYGEWNMILDRIFANLDYKDEWKVIKNEDGKVIDVNIDDDDYDIYKALSKRVFYFQRKFSRAKTKREKMIARSNWYQELFKKDRWTRKFMQKQKLYLKQNEESPGTAMFGSFGQKKRR